MQGNRDPYAGFSGPLDRISFRHLDFARVPIASRSTAGTAFYRWLEVGMPRIPDSFLDSVCYLYKDEEHARSGQQFGGTGFLASVPSRHAGVDHVYAVTNWHVACQSGFSVLRVNTKGGGVDVLEFGPEDWEFSPKYDIAVLSFPLNREVHRHSVCPLPAFMTRELASTMRLSVGEDVFMTGRFVDHDGGATNRPSVRFGHISIMPSPIRQPNGKMADSFCIDLSSRSGYSGSPVYIYRTPGYDLEKMPSTDGNDRILLEGTQHLSLLGIHWGQFPEEWEIRAGISPEIAKESALVREGKYVKGLSGMTCVLPAWCIAEVMNLPKLVQQRQNSDDAFEKWFKQFGRPPDAE